MILSKDEWNLRRIDGRYDSDKVCLHVVLTSSLLCYDKGQSSLVGEIQGKEIYGN